MDLEFWASPEPTIARIDERRYRDQRIETGHYSRDGDIERLSVLGVSGARYPVLWESVAPVDPELRDYTWERRRLRLLEKHGLEPIVTLLHHGSGPRYTSLLDEAFPQLFAAYAEATAREFPHVRRWTPINEPLTTARFSALYGTWYPNERDDRAFGRALVNELHGYLLAAKRIAAVIPGAEFMITEDLQSFTASDARAQSYADFKRARAYLSVDLACGNVDAQHPLWTYLTRRCDIPVERLDLLRSLARPPDLLGWNYYPNSERHLGTLSNGDIRNVPLVDVSPRPLNPKPMLRAAWQRYGLPMALAEVHVIGNDWERVRWLVQRHDDVLELRAEGLALRAFGAWAAFGLVDWNSLLCKVGSGIEDGIYSFAGPGSEPASTIVGDAIRALSKGFQPPNAATPGWWERKHASSA
jgi:dTDP-4-dehydrorhamnose reductase